MNTAKAIGGEVRENKYLKQTHWWSEKEKEEVKLKKVKKLKNKNNENYIKFNDQRVKVKELVKRTKQRAWEELGIKM